MINIKLGPKPMESLKKRQEMLLSPIEIPINYEGVSLGNVKIQFIKSDDIKEEPLKEALMLSYLPEEYFYVTETLKKDLERAINLERGSNKRRTIGFLLLYFYPQSPSWQPSKWHDCFAPPDDEIFDLIKSEGPSALRISRVQNKINEWLDDKKTAGVKINNLGKALLEYSCGPSFKTIMSRIGRPPKDIFSDWGTEWVPVLYKTLKSMLGSIKKQWKSSSQSGIEDIIVSTFGEFTTDINWKIEKGTGKPSKKEIEAYKRSLPQPEVTRILLSPIAECIENDKKLKSEFNKFKWKPYDMAIKIAAKLLSVHPQTIKNILHRKSK